MKAKLVQTILAVFSGLLLGWSWPEITGHTWMVFIAFIPLFYFIDKINTSQWRRLFLFSFISFFIWHLLSVHWMLHSTIIGSITAWLVNSFLMAGIICLSAFSASRIKKTPIEIILALYWISFEIMHLFWSLSWPWMSLGNVFANKIEWIQWYEYTGVYGGSIWIIIINGLLYRVLKTVQSQQVKSVAKSIIIAAAMLFIPILLSYSILKPPLASSPGLEISILQPNIDTYLEKFDKYSPEEQSRMIIDQLNAGKTNQLLLLPETVIPQYFNATKRPYPESIQHLLNWSKQHHKDIIGGFNTKDSMYSYNSALMIEEGSILQHRNKIKLLPFGEKMPFAWIYHVFKDQISRDGGNLFEYGMDNEAQVFQLDKFDTAKLGVLICFESVFPDLNCEMVQKGAQCLLFITNDDWWKDSAGHRQHFAYARLRAIENRRYIVRSANTGISGFIDDYGRVIEQTKYKEQTMISQSIPLNKELTFFSKYERLFRYLYTLMAFILFGLSLLHFSGKFNQIFYWRNN